MYFLPIKQLLCGSPACDLQHCRTELWTQHQPRGLNRTVFCPWTKSCLASRECEKWQQYGICINPVKGFSLQINMVKSGIHKQGHMCYRSYIMDAVKQAVGCLWFIRANLRMKYFIRELQTFIHHCDNNNISGILSFIAVSTSKECIKS